MYWIFYGGKIMPHTFSNALYYPSIDIKNSDWLKTAVLFWDTISTIVPSSIKTPYNTPETKYLESIGVLKPIIVSPRDISVVGIEDNILSILSSPEITNEIIDLSNSNFTRLYRSKMSSRVEEAIRKFQYSYLNSDELSFYLQEEIKRIINNDPPIYYYVNDSFSNLYMTVLANKLSEDNSLAMVTDSIPYFFTENHIKYGNQSEHLLYHNNNFWHARNQELAQGILLNYMVEGISIYPDTPLNEIISFKNKHRDELGHFKTELAKLTRGYENSNLPLDYLQNEIKNVYENEFFPAFSDLKSALNDFNIQSIINTIFKASVITASSTGIPAILMNLPIEKAIFAGIGLSVIASVVNYRVEKRELLRNNPYSYLLSIKKEW